MLERFGAAVALALAVAAPASAQDIINPRWAEMPGADAMAEAYPEFAALAVIDGDVTLHCTAARDGRLSLCQVLEHTPEGLGFDRAGLSLASLFRVSPLEIDGEAAKSSVQFTIRFRMPGETEPKPWTGTEPSAAHLSATRAFVDAMAAGEPDAMERFRTLDLEVDAERAEPLRAMLLQVQQEFESREKDAGALAVARVLTPEQLAAAQAGRGFPPRPAEDVLTRAGDVAERTNNAWIQRLHDLYCARYDCPALPPPPPGSYNPTGYSPD